MAHMQECPRCNESPTVHHNISNGKDRDFYILCRSCHMKTPICSTEWILTKLWNLYVDLEKEHKIEPNDCPNCGGKTNLINDITTSGYTHTFRVVCNIDDLCGVSGPKCKTKRVAIERWNQMTNKEKR